MAAAIVAASQGLDKMSPEHLVMYSYFMVGVWREWENLYYQFEQGLFDIAEFEPRMVRWHSQMLSREAHTLWTTNKEWHAPGFRARVDAMVADIERPGI